MKRIVLIVGSLLLTLTGFLAKAEAQPSLVIQIPESFYKHPVRLLNPYLNYWHNRAEAAEAVGLSSFQAENYETSSCENEARGQALVVIEPNMFYNPQTGVFYSEITAKVYTRAEAESALAKPLMTVKGLGQSRGWLTYNVETSTHQSYQQAFAQIIEQIQQHPAFEQSISQAPIQTYQALCTSIDRLSQPKLYF